MTGLVEGVGQFPELAVSQQSRIPQSLVQGWV